VAVRLPGVVRAVALAVAGVSGGATSYDIAIGIGALAENSPSRRAFDHE
jgi:hypothetical protein